MNRRDFLKGVASAAAGLVVPQVALEPKYTDEDVDQIVEENEALQHRVELLQTDIYRSYGILTDISSRLGAYAFPWAFYWRDLADQIESLCVERDNLREENRILKRENHELAFELWGLSIGEGITSEESEKLQQRILVREHLELGGADVNGVFDDLPVLREYWQSRAAT